MAKAVDKEIKELQDNIVEIKHLLEGQAKQVAGSAKKKGAKASLDVKKMARDIGYSAGKVYNQSKASISENTEKLSDKISENPLKSTLIAAGVGALVAAILKK